jgi:hypothetical protein
MVVAVGIGVKTAVGAFVADGVIIAGEVAVGIESAG